MLRKTSLLNPELIFPKATQAPVKTPERPRLLFVSTNGSGLGHLTRLWAVEKECYGFETLTYSMSSAYYRLGKPRNEIIYFPSHADLGIHPRVWSLLLEGHLGKVLLNYKPSAIVFDGTYVYRGLQHAARRHSVPIIWMRRGCWKDAVRERSKQWANPTRYVDAVISPSDYGCHERPSESSGAGRVVPPIVNVNGDSLRERIEIRQKYNLPIDRNLLLVQLGGGVINDVSGLLEAVLGAISTHSESWEPVVVRNPLARDGRLDRYRSISAYPLTELFPAFDAGVFAAGYNSVQESIYFGLPSLFLPNTNAVTDDQQRRAETLESDGLGYKAGSSEEIQASMDRLVRPENLLEIRSNMEIVQKPSGAREAAGFIREFLTA